MGLKVTPTHPAIEQVYVFEDPNVLDPLLPNNRIHGKLEHRASVLLTTFITIVHDTAKISVFHIFRELFCLGEI